MVFYRKYRPQTVSDLDLEKVREKLTSILKSHNISHAFLFAGPKGLGKTSAARIIAKAINCEKKNQESGIKNQEKKKREKDHDSSFVIHDSNDIEPCNKCDACLSITNGSNIDVLEIDAASNRGIDEIRELRDKIKFAPVSIKRKVYIIDEVHMLTNEAFNALLKTLEEPPPHAIFILCTTELWKLPDTIISRTSLIQFEKPSKEELQRSIKRVLDGENLKVDSDAYDEIYSLSDGSLRDATKLIEELSLISKDGSITKDLIEKSYKSKTIENKIYELMKFLSEKKAKEALSIIIELSNAGVDFKIVNEKIVNYLRCLLLKRNGLPVGREGFDERITDIESLDIDSLNKLTEFFSGSYKDLKYAVLPSLPLELVIIKWCTMDEIRNPNVGIRNNKEEKIADLNISPKQVSQVKKELISTTIATGDSEFFLKLIEETKRDNHSVAGLLRSCKVINIGEKEVSIMTPYKFHGDKLMEVKTKKIIEQKLSELLGREVSLVVEIKEVK